MSFVKKQKIGFWVYLVLVIMTAVSLGIYVANVYSAYYQDMNMKVVIMMAAAIILAAAAIVLPRLVAGRFARLAADACCIAVAVLVIVSGITFIGMRVESFGYIFGSNLELGNEAAFSAASQAVTGIILFAVTWIVSLLAAFLDAGKKSE